MATTASLNLSAVAKRVRERKYQEFGDQLRAWRGDRDIEEVVRQVRRTGVSFDGATLRGWEYGWTGRPDPMRLLALASVYERPAGDVIKVLATARGISGDGDVSDLIRHSGTGQSASDSAESRTDDDHGTRAQLQAALDESALEIQRLHEQLQAAQQLAVRIVLIAEEGEAAGEGRPKGSRRRRKTG